MRNVLVIAAFLGLLAAVWLHGDQHGRAATDAAWQLKGKKAVEAAVALEHKRQKGVNDALQKQADDLAGINAGLAADLDQLRQRPQRVRTIIYPGTTCKGATGADLSGEDAGFLTREAARADTIRAGLIACYAAYDALRPDHDTE